MRASELRDFLSGFPEVLQFFFGIVAIDELENIHLKEDQFAIINTEYEKLKYFYSHINISINRIFSLFLQYLTWRWIALVRSSQKKQGTLRTIR